MESTEAAAVQCLRSMADLLEQLQDKDCKSICSALDEGDISAVRVEDEGERSARLGQRLCQLHAMTIDGISTAAQVPSDGDELLELAAAIMPEILDAAGLAEVRMHRSRYHFSTLCHFSTPFFYWMTSSSEKCLDRQRGCFYCIDWRESCPIHCTRASCYASCVHANRK